MRRFGFVLLLTLPALGLAVNVDVLVVGGGGGGGDANNSTSGGGGAGSVEYVTGMSLSTGTGYTVTVGAGGAHGTNGSNSSFNGVTGYGGGRGGGTTGAVSSGGSGGGGYTNSGGAAAGSGSNVNAGGGGDNGGNGWAAGGGGGAGGAGGGLQLWPGAVNFNGGVGISNSITGTATYYGGGGGGGVMNTPNASSGGLGGGGGNPNGQTGANGTANTGGGGGGGGADNNSGTPYNGGSGGSGVVIIRYAGGTSATGGTITSAGGYTIHTFTSSGTFTMNNPVPVVTSATTASGTQGQAITSYQITATNSPTSFSATNLPAGLSVNTSTGVISGTPTGSGNTASTITATNAAGTSAGVTLNWSIATAKPVITSATTVSATQGQAFSYQIVATNSPTSYAVSGLPGGITVNTTSGLISGTPTVSGSYTSSMSATNGTGTGSSVSLNWTIAGPVVVVTADDTSAAIINGNVGIGSSAPLAKVDIQVPNAGNVNEGLIVERFGGASIFGFKLKSDGTGNFRGALTVKGNGTAEAESMSFGADVYPGYVGIGATQPSFPLSFGTGLGNKLAVYDAGGGNGYGFGVQNSLLQIFANTATDRVGIGYGNSVGFTETLTVKGGKVGVGIASPTHLLTVNGTIRAKEVIVDTGWADFVFEDDYPLAPLSDVESHIKAEKHLPGMPTAADVAAGGVSLGDMQAKLLQKIEELTLHQIAQEKRIQRLEAENAALRAK